MLRRSSTKGLRLRDDDDNDDDKGEGDGGAAVRVAGLELNGLPSATPAGVSADGLRGSSGVLAAAVGPPASAGGCPGGVRRPVGRPEAAWPTRTREADARPAALAPSLVRGLVGGSRDSRRWDTRRLITSCRRSASGRPARTVENAADSEDGWPSFLERLDAPPPPARTLLARGEARALFCAACAAARAERRSNSSCAARISARSWAARSTGAPPVAAAAAAAVSSDARTLAAISMNSALP